MKKIFTVFVLIGLIISCDEPNSTTLTRTVKIIGIAQVGQILTADTSSLGGSGEITYQWKRGTSNVGIDNNIYIIQTYDIGSVITVTVSRSAFSGSITSAQTDVVIGNNMGTIGLSYTKINNGTAYSVSKGTSNAAEIVIPAVYEGLPVVEILDSGFTSYDSLKSIILPNGVTRIGSYAFFHCVNLISILIPSGVTNIGNFAFQDCNGLTTIFYEGNSSLNWVSISVGSSNTALTIAKILYYSEIYPGTENTHWRFVDNSPVVWSTPGLVFTLINNDTEYKVSKGTATVDDIVIPYTYEGKSVTSIGYFGNYSNLKKIIIPDNITNIEGGAFNGCISLESIIIPNSIMSIGNGTFSDCIRLASITISNNVTIIGSHTFSGCISLESIVIPDSVISIGDGAFSGCTSLINITIPNSVTGIGINAFANCTSLISIFIPNSVISISMPFYYTHNEVAFFGCINLISITVDQANLYYTSEEGVLYNKEMTRLLRFPEGKRGSFSIPNSVTTIGRDAFYGCTNLTSVIIPSSVINIDYGAFAGCTSLINIIVDSINPNFTSQDDVLYNKEMTRLIGFSGGKNGSFTIPNGVTYIGYRVFENCNLTSIILPDSITSISAMAFMGCTSLMSIIIPNSVTYIDYMAFNNCNSLTSITLGASVYLYPNQIGNLYDAYSVGGAGTYATTNPGSNAVWRKR